MILHSFTERMLTNMTGKPVADNIGKYLIHQKQFMVRIFFLFYVKSKVVYNTFYFSVMKEVTEESHHKENFPPHLMKVQNFIRHLSVAVLLEVMVDLPQQFLMF